MDDDRIELTKENLPQKNYGKFILRSSLAIECLEDLAGVDPDKEGLINNMYDNLRKYRKLNQEIAREEAKLVNEIMDIIDILGKEKFAFYDDGNIEYIGNWRKRKDG